MAVIEKVKLPGPPLPGCLNRSRKYSLWMMQFGLVCCGIEMGAAIASKFDIIRFRSQPPSRFASAGRPPRHRDRHGQDGSTHQRVFTDNYQLRLIEPASSYDCRAAAPE